MDHNPESWERVEEDDPNRCQSLSHRGTAQCLYKAVPNSDYCPRHGGNKQQESNNQTNLHNIRLTFSRGSRIKELTQGPSVKTLYDEIAVLRFQLEDLLNAYGNDPVELRLRSPLISQMVINITKTVEACQKLEERQGEHLDAIQIEWLTDAICDVVVNYVDEERIESVVQELNECFTKAAGYQADPQIDNEV
jgi:hypothetical protein